jgi:hypothetical protein
MDDQSEAYDEYRLLPLNGTIDENEYIVLSLNEPIEPIEPMEPMEEPIELKEPIEGNAEAYDECTLIDDPVGIEDAKSKAYDEYKLLPLPSPDELIERTNVGNKVGNNVGGKVGDKVGDNVGDSAQARFTSAAQKSDNAKYKALHVSSPRSLRTVVATTVQSVLPRNP